jgi:phage terminase large subunit-like protein
MKRRAKPPITSLAFFARLKWLDGRPLLDTIEPYRRAFFAQALDSRRGDGVPTYNFVLSGRAKKNWKSTDLVLAALYCLLIRDSVSGNDGFILANDEEQAGDDLEIAKKLIATNPALAAELAVLTKEIRRHDGRGALKILPARDVVGAHGKTYGFCGVDEIHGYKSYDLFESLPDGNRHGPQAIFAFVLGHNRPSHPETR